MLKYYANYINILVVTNKKGQNMGGYALIISGIVVVAFAILLELYTDLTHLFQSIMDSLFL